MSEFRRAYRLLKAYVNREYERITEVDRVAAGEELVAGPSAEPSAPVPAELTPEERKSRARQILGVGESAPFAEIRHAFERLNRRSVPENFPQGSTERHEAARLNERVNWAYRVLSEDIPESEKRFGSLEIE